MTGAAAVLAPGVLAPRVLSAEVLSAEVLSAEVLATGAWAVVVAGAVLPWVVLSTEAANAGAAMTETASSAAEMVFNMVSLLFQGIARSPAGWSASLIMQTNLRKPRGTDPEAW